jgi:hypothetical protein
VALHDFSFTSSFWLFVDCDLEEEIPSLLIVIRKRDATDVSRGVWFQSSIRAGRASI